MSKVGTVLFQNKDYAEGEIRTRTMKLNVRLYREKKKEKDNQPDFDVREILSDGTEVGIGKAWDNTAKSGPNFGGKFISMTMDDPSFPMPLNVALFQVGETDEYDVVWTRPKEKAA